jgi:hypothetical protein
MGLLGSRNRTVSTYREQKEMSSMSGKGGYKVSTTLASQTIASWNPLADWLQAVEKLRRAGLGPERAVSASSTPTGLQL